MAKNKPNKTYFVFYTIDGVIGVAAGLGACSNSSVKEADRMALRQNGYKQVGPVFTRSGRLSIEEVKEMIKKGEAGILDRVHVSSFISRKDEYAARAAKNIELMKSSKQREAEREAAEKAEMERRKTAKKLIEVYSYYYEDPDSEKEVLETFESLDKAWEYVEAHYSYHNPGGVGRLSEVGEIFSRDDSREHDDMAQTYIGGYYGQRICYRTIWV